MDLIVDLKLKINITPTKGNINSLCLVIIIAFVTSTLFLSSNDLSFAVKENENKEAQTITASPLSNDRNDPFAYFVNVIRGNIKVNKYDLSSAETNDIVVKILDAAKQSSKTGKTIIWKEYYKK